MTPLPLVTAPAARFPPHFSEPWQEETGALFASRRSLQLSGQCARARGRELFSLARRQVAVFSSLLLVVVMTRTAERSPVK